MPSLSMRLSDELDHKLEEEATREGVPRSEVVRIAVSDYLARKERERFMAEIVAEVRVAYANEDIRREIMELQDDFAVSDAEALDIAEGRKPGEQSTEEQPKWWK